MLLIYTNNGAQKAGNRRQYAIHENSTIAEKHEFK